MNNADYIAERDRYPQLDGICIEYPSQDATSIYRELFELKDKVSKVAYAGKFRRLLKMSHNKVPTELILQMFEGIAFEDIMYPEELAVYSCWPNSITIYRGAKSDEKVPGVSWTLDRKIAENEFYVGKLWEAVIDKKDVLAYFSKDETEEEIVTNVTAGFRELDV